MKIKVVKVENGEYSVVFKYEGENDSKPLENFILEHFDEERMYCVNCEYYNGMEVEDCDYDSGAPYAFRVYNTNYFVLINNPKVEDFYGDCELSEDDLRRINEEE